MLRRAKIVATIGPSCDRESTLKRMIKSGVDVCRLNFSFGSHDEHRKKIEKICNISKKTGQAVAILQDLQGPKIRIGNLDSPVKLSKDDTVILSGKSEHKDKLYLPTTYPKIAADIETGKTILLSDGKIILKVKKTDKKNKEVHCRVITGGTILSGRGINLPYTKISLPSLTSKDADDALFGAKAGVDFIGLSFVRTGRDIDKLKKLLSKNNYDIPVIAKIEKPEALDNIDDIIDRADGVMIARGDLAVEISYARVPGAQKEIIRKANQKGKLTIIATEMLGSMVSSTLPTRAETADVANAILDGTDAVMLSNETAVGDYPVKTVQVMNRIISQIESDKYISGFRQHMKARLDMPDIDNVTESVCLSAAYLSDNLERSGLVAFTHSGIPARILSKYRPRAPIFAVSNNQQTYNRLAFYHNVHPVMPGTKLSGLPDESLVNRMEKDLCKRGLAGKKGQLIVLVEHNASAGRILDTIKVRC